MKIKIEQLDEKTRGTVARAIDDYVSTILFDNPETACKYADIAIKIRHGELLLCEYEYQSTEDEEGGDYGI